MKHSITTSRGATSGVILTILIALLFVVAFWMGKWYFQYARNGLSAPSPITQYVSSTQPQLPAAQPPAATSTFQATTTTQVTTSVSSTKPGYYSDVAAWETAENQPGAFKIAYPIDFQVENFFQANPSDNWRLDTNGDPGDLAFLLTIPKAVEPQTNFNEARLTVGYSTSSDAIKNCTANTENGTVSTKAINGTTFHVFVSNGAAAGNRYDVTSYRVVHGGRCVVVEYVIHSSVIENYPSSYGLKPFDEAYIDAILKRIVGTFKFT